MTNNLTLEGDNETLAKSFILITLGNLFSAIYTVQMTLSNTHD